MMLKKILLVEDEPALAEIVKETLEGKNFMVFHACTVESALKLHAAHQPDIMVLDVMLPDGDGLSLLKKIRMTDRNTPAIFLTSKSLTSDVVAGFESGANDYIKKPFSMEELVVRLRFLLGVVNTHSNTSEQRGPLAIGEYTYHYPEGFLVFKGAKKQLTFREAEILIMLATEPRQIISRKVLLMQYWGDDDYFSGRSLDVFITKLRKYMKEDPAVAILNFRGQGYKLIS